MAEKKFPVVDGDPKEEPPEKSDDVVWMACRGGRNCEGKHARLVRRWKNEGGGSSIRYICLTCNRPFHVNF